jgi:putative FmdB family regulatory protein
MPTYEYRCPKGHEFERFYRTISAGEAELPCPECGAMATRQLSAGGGLVFKGSGFYLTDYGKNAHRGASPGAKGESAKGGSEKSESTKTEGAKAGSGKAEGGKAEGGKAEGGKAEGGKAEGGKTQGPTSDSSKTKSESSKPKTE